MKLKFFVKSGIRIEIIAKPKRKLKLWTHLFVSRTEIMRHYGAYHSYDYLFTGMLVVRYVYAEMKFQLRRDNY